MKAYLKESYLTELAEKHGDKFRNNSPFPYIAIDNFFNEDALTEALDSFPKPEDMDFYKYDNPLEKKLAMDQLTKLPAPIVNVLLYLNSAPVLQFLEKLTGIEGLIPDPYYRGGGIHQIQAGGKLDVHIDFNKYTKLNLDRRLNLILYLNKDWEESYGGHLDIWKGRQENGKHILEECVEKILPVFNRMTLFATSEKSYHGHPDPVTCPDGWSRKSLALYYYTVGRPQEEDVEAHSTTFIARPEDPDTEELNTLRDKRNKGRLSTNVTPSTE
ncbi:proline hydroxylase [Candidatus Marinamargulisbacteria bacterium SCGC AG-439-L15]|nr:proline hydroxylase [Candidatus Marinamargulisbacteria bacterium SCGC AG-439-L15]